MLRYLWFPVVPSSLTLQLNIICNCPCIGRMCPFLSRNCGRCVFGERATVVGVAHGTGVNQNCWQSKWSRCVFLSWFFFWFSFTFVLLYLSAFSRFPPILFILNWSCHLALCLTAVFHFRSFIFSCSFFLCVFLFLSSVSTYHSLPFSMRFFLFHAVFVVCLFALCGSREKQFPGGKS